MNWHPFVLMTHVACGTLALASFWTTAAMRKGTSLHRRCGTFYLVAMVGVMVTALPLAGAAFAAGLWVTGVFLSYLVVITATPSWAAWRAIRARRSVTAFLRPPFRFVAWANVVCGTVVFGLGVREASALLIGLSVIGLFVGIRMLRFARHGATGNRWWLKQHYTQIVGSGIAMHVAFLNVGLPDVMPRHAAAATYFAWFGPVLVAVLAVQWLDRRYGRGDGVHLTRTPAEAE